MSIEIEYEGLLVRPLKEETLLEAFEHAGISVPSSCRVGVCHFCLLKATSGKVPKKAKDGLDKKLQDSGHFKSCVCYPEVSMTVEPAHSAPYRGRVTVRAIEAIGHDIVQVTLDRPKDFDYIPGQFVTFRFENGHARSYSIASLCTVNSDRFNIHVRKIPNGKMSNWFHGDASPGDSLWMEGPKGECTYKREAPNEDLLLVGTGTGMAPLYAISLDALQNGHHGRITIVQGALSIDRLYLTDYFKELESNHQNVKYKPSVLNGTGLADISVGDLRQIALDSVATTSNLRIYLCGDPGLVRQLKKHFFWQKRG